MTIREIDERLEEGKSLKSIAQSYAEIANLKIKAIRSQVERNRLFFQEISKIYALVRRLSAKKGLTIKKPKKLVTVLITSNYHFYGTINFDLIQFFIKNTQKLETERIIIGGTALEYFKATNIFMDQKTVLLKQDIPDNNELSMLIELIKQYTQVLIVHSTFKSLLIQESVVTDITPTILDMDTDNLDIKYIFEPELPKILSFFDSSILALLLEETFLESELSRMASRFISMDEAQSEANKFIKQYIKLKALAKRSLGNKRILENYASLMATKKEEFNYG